ncbi:hypothetical protein KHC28_14385 [Ancylobacter sonchi]|uniref:hypothetical protein n=1 Tax=Ancylobacter sonchi TaxID=1937790 RepID=UPI001BD638A3|nr:hypothetical protein [Ancylobacter sonchi]MBS7534845.1 hypothetical protein [Ancylobacter sonchi]
MPDLDETVSNLELALDDLSATLAMVERSADRSERLAIIDRTERSSQQVLAIHRNLNQLGAARRSTMLTQLAGR